MKDPGIGSEKIIRRKRDGELEYQPDDLTVEEPLEIRIGRKALATTMRTPGHDEELAAGFLVSEGIARKNEQIAKISRPADSANRENIIVVELAGGTKLKLSSAKRFGTISTSCGICGKSSIAAIRQNFPPIASARNVRINIETLLSLPQLLEGEQGDFARTGGIHAAGIFDLIMLWTKRLVAHFSIVSCRWIDMFFSSAAALLLRSCKKRSPPEFRLLPQFPHLRLWQ